MLAGIVFQMSESISAPSPDMHLPPDKVGLVIYASLAAEFVVRFAYNRPFKNKIDAKHYSKKPVVETATKHMLFGLCVETVFLLIRCVDRHDALFLECF